MADERRRHPRVSADFPFRLVNDKGQEEAFSLVDLSEAGVRIRCAHAIPAMTRVQVALILPGHRMGRAKDVRLDTNGVVVWSHRGEDGSYDTGVFFPELEAEQRALLQSYVQLST